MNRKFNVFIFFIFLSFIVNGQKITFERDTFDFGNVPYGSQTTRELKFKNSGKDTLIITSQPNTASGCDMAYLKGDKRKYGPNEEGIVIYDFDTKLVRHFFNTISIPSNDKNGTKILFVNWTVLPDTAVVVDIPTYPRDQSNRYYYPSSPPQKIVIQEIDLIVPDSIQQKDKFYVQVINKKDTITFRKLGAQTKRFIVVDTNTILRIHYNGINVDVFAFLQFCNPPFGQKYKTISLQIRPGTLNNCYWVRDGMSSTIHGARSRTPCPTCLDQSFPCDFYYCQECMLIELQPCFIYKWDKPK